MNRLEVQHDRFPENEIVINGVWCDIGSHKVREDELVRMNVDATCCEGCYDNFN